MTNEQMIHEMEDFKRRLENIEGIKGKGLSHKNLADISDHSNFVTRDGSRPFTGPVDFGGNTVANPGNPILGVNTERGAVIVDRDTNTLEINTDEAEAIDDRVSQLIQDADGISWSYNDAANTLTPSLYSSYAELYTDDGGVSRTVTTAGTYYVITGLTAGTVKGSPYVTQSAANGTITIGTSGGGLYKVNVSISFSANQISVVHFAIHKGGTRQANLTTQVSSPVTTITHNANITGLISLASADVLDLRVTSTVNATAVTLPHINMNIEMVQWS